MSIALMARGPDLVERLRDEIERAEQSNNWTVAKELTASS